MNKTKNNCPICQKNEATNHRVYGVMPCENCQKESTGEELAPKVEFTSSTIRGQRKEYMRSHMQPWVNGVLSREYIETFGTDKIAVTEKEVKEAKYVYRDMPRWHKRNESKL